MNFGGAQFAAATLALHQDSLQQWLSLTTRNWLQLQPVELRTNTVLFGPALHRCQRSCSSSRCPRPPRPVAGDTVARVGGSALRRPPPRRWHLNHPTSRPPPTHQWPPLAPQFPDLRPALVAAVASSHPPVAHRVPSSKPDLPVRARLLAFLLDHLPLTRWH